MLQAKISLLTTVSRFDSIAFEIDIANYFKNMAGRMNSRYAGVWAVLILTVLYVFGHLLLFFNYQQSGQNLWVFVLLYALTFFVAPPRRAICPLSMFYLYYGLWFVVAPIFAERYQDGVLLADEFGIAFYYAYAVFGLGVICILLGERSGWASASQYRSAFQMSSRFDNRVLGLLYLASTTMVLAIVLSSGGFAVWVADPGDAFLNRAGSGIYVVLSHFFSMALAALSGYFAFTKRHLSPIFLFLTWVIATSPIHGSKFQISLLIVIALIPWVRKLRFFSFGATLLGVGLVAVFFLGLYFRNMSWIDFETMLPYALNYFTALDNLAVSIRDFSPDLMKTFFLPFNKILTPFGLDTQVAYYDMNHLLTDIYFPHAWEIRATEQWPVETDLYLNFYFFWGLPVVGVFLFATGWLYGYAERADNLGGWLAALVVTLFMISHLRGSLVNHTDFYMYPYIAFMYFVFRNYRFEMMSSREKNG